MLRRRWCSSASIILTLAIGRLLKRHGGVRFGVIFQLFCLALAFYAALATYGVRPPWRGHIGSLLVLLGTGVLITLLNRYLWDY